MAGYNVGALVVKIQADVTDLGRVNGAMLQVQRDILVSVNKIVASFERMGGKSQAVSAQMAAANKSAQENIRSELQKTANTQNFFIVFSPS